MWAEFVSLAQISLLILPITQAAFIHRLRPEEPFNLEPGHRPPIPNFGPFKNKSDHLVDAPKVPHFAQLPPHLSGPPRANSSFTFPVDSEGFVHCGHPELGPGASQRKMEPGKVKHEMKGKRDFHCALKAYMALQAKSARDFAIPTGTIERRDAFVEPEDHDLRASRLRKERERYLPDAPII